MKRPGFSLIELMLVIAIIMVLAAIVVVAINPTKQLDELCKKEPSNEACQGRPTQTDHCLKRTDAGCCTKAHEELDEYRSPILVCDEYVPF